MPMPMPMPMLMPMLMPMRMPMLMPMLMPIRKRSQAQAQGLLQKFKASGFYDPDVSLLYRDLVLRPGGKLSAETLMFSFLGAPPSLDALHAWLRGED